MSARSQFEHDVWLLFEGLRRAVSRAADHRFVSPDDPFLTSIQVLEIVQQAIDEKIEEIKERQNAKTN